MHSSGLVLTARESCVLSALATCGSDPEIAEALCISVSHVENTIYHLKRRFGITSDKLQAGRKNNETRNALRKIAIDLFV